MRASTLPRLLVILMTASSVAVPAAGPSTAQEELPAPPNILLIVTDDQRTDTMEAMPKTMRLFADRGTTFTDAYSTTPLCCPSRASIMTGLYAHNHNVKTQTSAGATLDVGLTVQRHLQPRGYRTGFIGKWLNGWDLQVRPPYLDEAAIFTSAANSYAGAEWNVDGRLQTVPGYSTRFMTERATGFIERSEHDDETPWLLMITPPQPHSPFTPQWRFQNERFSVWQAPPNVGEIDKSDKPPWVADKQADRFRGRRLRTKQMRTLRSVDQMVGAIFRSLVDHGEASDTLAVFTSDNGFLWGEHGIANIKRYPYTSSVQVPMYLRWPGRVPEGSVDPRFAANIDLAPTFLEVAGDLERAAELDGRSLLQPSTRSRILLEYWNENGRELAEWASTRTDEYQYIEYYDPAGTVIYREYYDLVADPYQLENLFGNDSPLDDPPWVPLSNELQQLRECSGQSCP